MAERDIWTKAPKEATHYSEGTRYLQPVYYRVEGGEAVSAWVVVGEGVALGGGWKLDQGYPRFDYNNDYRPEPEVDLLIERPTPPHGRTPSACEGMGTVDKGVTMKTYLKNLDLVFGSSSFSGGRLDKKGGGVVEVCFQAMGGGVDIVLFDNMSKEDGHYSPVCLTKEQAETLRDWLTYKLEEMK